MGYVKPFLLATYFFTLCALLQSEVFTYEVELEQQLFHTLNIEAARVVAMVVLSARDGIVTLGEELVVVEVARVAGDAEVVAHILGANHLLACNKRLV